LTAKSLNALPTLLCFGPVQEDLMKAVRKLNEAKKLEGTLDSTFRDSK